MSQFMILFDICKQCIKLIQWQNVYTFKNETGNLKGKSIVQKTTAQYKHTSVFMYASHFINRDKNH